LIVDAALKNRIEQFVLDGEAKGPVSKRRGPSVSWRSVTKLGQGEEP
jgi:hypothetical protein